MSLRVSGEDSWDLELLGSICEPEFVRAIVEMNRPSVDCANKLILTNNTFGKFTVKEGYRKIVEARLGDTYNPVWRKIWRANLHKRLKMHLWWIQAKVLSTREVLAKRFPRFEQTCLRCGAEVEITTHVIQDCHLTCALAFGSCWGFKFHYFREGRPSGLVEEYCNLSKEIVPQEVEPLFVSTFLATFFYVAWNARNDFIFKGKRCLEQWIKFLEVSVRDFLQVNNTDDCSTSAMEKIMEKLWEKPEQGWAKVNVDTAFKNAVLLVLWLYAIMMEMSSG